MDFKKKIIPATLTLLLGVGTLGIANAAPIDYYQDHIAAWVQNDPNPMPMNNSSGNIVVKDSNAPTEPTTANTKATPAEVTPDLVNQMLQNCLQANQAMIDKWANTSGLSQDDILEMERGWMQGVMQKNPNLNAQDAVQMHQAWINNKLANYKTTNTQAVQATQQVQQPQVQRQVQQSNANQQTPPARSYNGWNCGWNNGYCW